MIVNLTSMSNFDDVLEWIRSNPEIAKWKFGKPLIFEDHKIYVSSIEFFNDEDCLFYSLKFGLV